MCSLLIRRILSFLVVAHFIMAAAPAGAANFDAQNYRHAFAAVDSGHVEQVEMFAARGRDPVLNKVLRGYAMALPGNDYSFDDLAGFMTENPDWPNLKGIQMIAEQKLPPSAQPIQLVNWFTAHPPITQAAFYKLIDALGIVGQNDRAATLIRTRWMESDMNADELAAYHARFGAYLNANVNYERLDHWLWKGDVGNIRRTYPYVDAGHKALAEARLKLATSPAHEAAIVASVPADLRNDPGLQYEILRWKIRDHDDEAAINILQSAAANQGKPEQWWEERQVIIRRLIEARDFSRAYALAAAHGQITSKTLVQGEFLAGWLALRFLKQPEIARDHFQDVYDSSQTPMSRARGAYWLGRSYEALGQKTEAEQAYEDAAALNVTYYGELATMRIFANPVMRVQPEPAIPAPARNSFFDRDLIRAIEHLYNLGDHERTRIFFKAAVDAAQQRAEFVMLTELAYRLHHPDYAIQAGKAANQKNMLIGPGGYPLLEHALPSQPEPAFTHALIRQESLFNPDALSPVGARGLMQLMPATAREEAKKLGVRYRDSMLGDVDMNLRLGSAYVQRQIDSFNGSYVLALAGYNAGPGRVREWMREFGDPRSPEIDAVDWVELIPIYETRNYVQRIIESLQIYRARLHGGTAPLNIINDLKR